jgi:hypothetical protein
VERSRVNDTMKKLKIASASSAPSEAMIMAFSRHTSLR